jgi:DNA-binding transcriptional LysR family regulator
MSDFIAREIQLAAVVLEEELDFSEAARRLNIEPLVLHAEMQELATRMELSIFKENDGRVEVTEEGRVLIDAFRSLLKQTKKMPEE